jgi:hypothetical protein
MISSLITLRLKRRSALSIDSLLLTDIYAIYAYHPLFGWIKLTQEQTIIKYFFSSKRKSRRQNMEDRIQKKEPGIWPGKLGPQLPPGKRGEARRAGGAKLSRLGKLGYSAN